MIFQFFFFQLLIYPMTHRNFFHFVVIVRDASSQNCVSQLSHCWTKRVRWYWFTGFFISAFSAWLTSINLFFWWVYWVGGLGNYLQNLNNNYFQSLLFLQFVLSASTRGQCLTDRNCDQNHKCINRHCFHQREYVFKCINDLTCPDFHSCHNGVCLMEKASSKNLKLKSKRNVQFELDRKYL